jgi:hypothetical protein
MNFYPENETLNNETAQNAISANQYSVLYNSSLVYKINNSS